MTTLVLGASGATGRLVVRTLLERGERVRIIVRSTKNFPKTLLVHENLTVIFASVLDLSNAETIKHVNNCQAVVSCLGHNLTFKGIFGAPRRLVTDATRQLCAAIAATPQTDATKFILMNTAGNSNRDLNEPISLVQKIVTGLIRALLPPHADNEEAADYLRTEIGQNRSVIEWVAVRPDGLIDDEEVSEFEIHSSPTRSAIFNAGKTSRINVACFMADLITSKDVWSRWRGAMPVIYNAG